MIEEVKICDWPGCDPLLDVWQVVWESEAQGGVEKRGRAFLLARQVSVNWPVVDEQSQKRAQLINATTWKGRHQRPSRAGDQHLLVYQEAVKTQDFGNLKISDATF